MDALGNEAPHILVDPPPRQDEIGEMPDFVGAMGEIEGINADAMASDEPRREVEEVPFRARRLENVISGNAKLLENHCRLIDEGDVDVALRILDDLRGLGRLDVAGAEGAARGRSAIHVSEDIRHL